MGKKQFLKNSTRNIKVYLKVKMFILWSCWTLLSFQEDNHFFIKTLKKIRRLFSAAQYKHIHAYTFCVLVLWSTHHGFNRVIFIFLFNCFHFLHFYSSVWCYCWVQRCHKYDEFTRTKTQKSKGNTQTEGTKRDNHTVTFNYEWGTHMAI